jgi:hypothetical protein
MAEPHGQLPEPRARSSMASVPESNPEASLHVVAPYGAGGVCTGCLRLLAFIRVAIQYSNFCCCLLVLGFRATDAGALVVSEGVRDDDKLLRGCLEHVSYMKAVFNLLW